MFYNTLLQAFLRKFFFIMKHLDFQSYSDLLIKRDENLYLDIVTEFLQFNYAINLHQAYRLNCY
jgi:hypothetical protein